MKPYYRLNGLKGVEQRRLFSSYVIMLSELVTHSEHHRIVLFELISQLDLTVINDIMLSSCHCALKSPRYADKSLTGDSK